MGDGPAADQNSPLQSTVGASFPPSGGSLQMHSKMMRYDRVVRRLNEFRKEGFAFGLVSALGEASIGTSAGDSVGHKRTRLLTFSTDADYHSSARPKRPRPGASCRTSSASGTSSTASSSAPPSKSASMLARTSCPTRRVKRRSRSARWSATARASTSKSSQSAGQHTSPQGYRSHPTSTRFMAYVEKTLASRPAEAALGGVPSIQNKIRGFLNVKYQKNGQWPSQGLEVHSEASLRAR